MGEWDEIGVGKDFAKKQADIEELALTSHV
jgi:hypothetical protein